MRCGDCGIVREDGSKKASHCGGEWRGLNGGDEPCCNCVMRNWMEPDCFLSDFNYATEACPQCERRNPKMAGKKKRCPVCTIEISPGSFNEDRCAAECQWLAKNGKSKIHSGYCCGCAFAKKNVFLRRKSVTGSGPERIDLVKWEDLEVGACRHCSKRGGYDVFEDEDEDEEDEDEEDEDEDEDEDEEDAQTTRMPPKKAAAKKSPAKKATAVKKTVTKKPAPKKTAPKATAPAKKAAPSKKAAPKKSPAKKTATKKPAAKKTAKKSPAKKAKK